jgi:DNA polymerase
MKLTIDFETRAYAKLGKKDSVGAWRYSEDPLTDIFCLAVKADNNPPFIWLNLHNGNELFHEAYNICGSTISDNDLIYFIDAADTIEAHNAEFERAIWLNIMHLRYGFPEIPLRKFRCSAAKAAAHSLPRNLDDAVKALKLPVLKDADGYKLMLKMSKPRKARKKEWADMVAQGVWEVAPKLYYHPAIQEYFCLWYENAEDIVRLCQYCMQDVEAEYALSEALSDLNPVEQELWFVDQQINQRGIPVDVPMIKSMIEMITDYEDDKLLELEKLTSGDIQSPKQTAKTLTWLNSWEGVNIQNVQKQTVEELVKQNIPAPAKRMCELRLALSKTSTAKYGAFLNMVCKDGTVKGSTLYHAASTGRFGGRGIQPHNMPRAGYSDIENVLRFVAEKKYWLVSAVYDELTTVASKCLRSAIKAKPGYDLLVADYSSIEARVLAWLANETEVLNAFVNKLDLYVVEAMGIYNKAYEDVNKEERQIGKVATLALGYQGGVGAFQSMAKNYGVIVSDDKAEDIKKAWRAARPNIVELWNLYENAAITAVRTGKMYKVGDIRFGVSGKFLHIQLPSLRLLSYYDPHIAMVETPWGAHKEAVVFMGVDSETYKWIRMSTYGGKITENIVQATARDILTEALMRLEYNGYPAIFHVHDEVISTLPKNEGHLEEFISLMEVLPAWANGLPINATGYREERYRKD